MKSRLEIFEKELTDRKYILGDNHPDVAETHNILGIIKHHVYGNHEEALSHHREALSILSSQKLVDEYFIDIGITQSDLGNVLWKMGNFVEAIISYIKAFILLKYANVDDLHPVVHSISSRFPDLKDLYGKQEDNTDWKTLILSAKKDSILEAFQSQYKDSISERGQCRVLQECMTLYERSCTIHKSIDPEVYASHESYYPTSA